jgi:hypothetical protein
LVFAICRSSFPLVGSSGLFPSWRTRKQVARAVTLAILAAAGCGGDGDGTPQTVAGPGYRFAAPGDWNVERAGRTLSAESADGQAAVSVTSFRLTRSYRPELWGEIELELDRVAERLARELDGAVVSRATIELGGRRARRYGFDGARDETRRIGFVLRGRREYQLLCRGDSEGDSACEQLFASFTLLP